MKVLVTGGSGFLGGHIVQELERRGKSVIVLDLAPPLYETCAEFIQADIVSGMPTQLNTHDISIVFHAAGSLGTHTTFDRIEETFKVNVMGMISLMDWARSFDESVTNDWEAEKQIECRERKIINCGLIRDWLNPYMVSKHTASKIGRMYADVFGVRFLDVRMTVVYGPRQGWKEEKIVPRFILKMLKGLPLPIFGDGESLMNMMYVKDVTKILVDLSENDDLFSVRAPVQLDLANPNGDISVIDFAEAIVAAIDEYAVPDSRLEYLDMRRGQPGFVSVSYDLTQAHRYISNLGDRFRLLSDGLEETIAWYRGVVQ